MISFPNNQKLITCWATTVPCECNWNITPTSDEKFKNMKNNRTIIKIKNTCDIKKEKIIRHENVFKNWLRPNFLLLPPKKGGDRKFAGVTAAPPPPRCPPGPYAPFNETKKDKLFLKQLRSSYLLG